MNPSRTTSCLAMIVISTAALSSFGAPISNSSDTSVNPRTEGPTADQTKTSSGDVILTSEIRRELLKQYGLSTNAANIKIITDNGRVTLRGRVESAEEKTKVEQVAYDCAGKQFVTSNLEVKRN